MIRLFLFVTLIIPLLSACTQTASKSAEVEQTFSETWKFRAGEGKDSLWMNPEYNDKGWTEVSSIRLLSEQQQKTDNGFGWYRKNIVLSDSLKKAFQTSGALVLHLGHLAAADEVWMNGNFIGKTGDYPPNYTGYHDEARNYLVSGKFVNADGENLIAIKFNEGWGVGGFLKHAQLTVASAGINDKLFLDVVPDDSDYVFLTPKPIRIKINLKNLNKKKVPGKLYVKVTTDAYVPVRIDSIDISIKGLDSFSKTFTLAEAKPGFYRYDVKFVRKGETACEKKLNVGFDPEKITSPVDAKADFKPFWENSLKELKKVAPRYKLTLVPEYSKLDYNVYLVDMYSLNNEPIKGYYARPKRKGKFPVIVEYMGYGSSPYPPNQTWDGFAYFVLSIRGQALNLPKNHYGTWVTYGLNNKADYYYRGAYCDVVRALDFICTRPEVDSSRIAVRGGSQGGALSFVAAALDKRVKVAAPFIPFLSDFPDYFKIAPWPKSDFATYLQEHPNAKWNDIYELLTYFDIKNLAQWIECPLYMGIGIQDNVCPPRINFAAYNQVKTEKHWMACPQCGHSVGKIYHEASMKFIKEKLNVE